MDEVQRQQAGARQLLEEPRWPARRSSSYPVALTQARRQSGVENNAPFFRPWTSLDMRIILLESPLDVVVLSRPHTRSSRIFRRKHKSTVLLSRTVAQSRRVH